VRERVLILGSGDQAIELAKATLERRASGFQIVGFVDNKPELIGKSLINPSVIGLTKDIGSLVERHQVDRIVVAVADRRGKFPTEELLHLSLSGRVAVEESARYYERLTGKIASEMLRPSWLIFSRGNRFSDLEYHVRRVLNAGFAAAGLVMSIPIMLLTALAVKLDSPGPIFYVQERVGKNGRTFKIVKFRSMRVGAEATSGPVWAEEDDPRVTRVGRIIRKLRFDELPQFVNVLRGDMNFVGPRPERPMFVDQLSEIVPYYSQRHVVKPGLTGWAQIKYPYGASVEDAIEKLRYDLYYIKNQSLLLDAIIVFETTKIVMFGRGGR
jgi:sugar transferase (PEP-CTERM system associated)